MIVIKFLKSILPINSSNGTIYATMFWSLFYPFKTVIMTVSLTF